MVLLYMVAFFSFISTCLIPLFYICTYIYFEEKKRINACVKSARTRSRFSTELYARTNKNIYSHAHLSRIIKFKCNNMDADFVHIFGNSMRTKFSRFSHNIIERDFFSFKHIFSNLFGVYYFIGFVKFFV